MPLPIFQPLPWYARRLVSLRPGLRKIAELQCLTVNGENPMPSYMAIKAGQSRAADLGLRSMGTVVCDACGERFLIDHPASFADKNLAAKQSEWLEKILAYDHECQRPHPDKIVLP
jgi:hypothetical protein